MLLIVLYLNGDLRLKVVNQSLFCISDHFFKRCFNRTQSKHNTSLFTRTNNNKIIH